MDLSENCTCSVCGLNPNETSLIAIGVICFFVAILVLGGGYLSRK